MFKIWLKTISDTQTVAFKQEFWSKHSEDLRKGVFWADKIKEYAHNPILRLKLAIDNLPLPAAFREALVAIRTLIKTKQRIAENYEDELTLLYFLAAIHSFIVPYSEVLKEPGFNVIESMPGDIFKNLPFTYKELGYERLSLLNKTDRKFLIKLWGEPDNHSTLNDIYSHLWHQYELKLLEARMQQRNESIDFYNTLLGKKISTKRIPAPNE